MWTHCYIAIELFQNFTMGGEKQSARYAYSEITNFELSRKGSRVRQCRTVDAADCYTRLNVNGRTIGQHVSHQGRRETIESNDIEPHVFWFFPWKCGFEEKASEQHGRSSLARGKDGVMPRVYGHSSQSLN